MDRDIKVFNRPVIQKIQQRNRELHLSRLKNARVSLFIFRANSLLIPNVNISLKSLEDQC